VDSGVSIHMAQSQEEAVTLPFPINFYMNLNILSYNIRGLNNPAKVRKMKNYLRTLQPPCDILLLQEYKLCGINAHELGRSLWPDSACYILDAEPGYTLAPDGAGKGGVCTLVSPLLKHLIVSSGSLRDNRALWITLTGTPMGQLGVANIYAPNCSSARSELWENLPNCLDNSCTWLLGGDWNMTEKAGDKTSGCSRGLSQAESTSWSLLKASMDFEDWFNTNRNIRYSWDNKRLGARVMARLDRFYLSKGELNKPLIADYKIRGDCGLSDHLPVSLSLSLQKKRQTGSCYKMNSSLLLLPEVQTEITRLWTSFPKGTHFLVKFRRVIRYYRRFCQLQATAQNRTETDLRLRFSKLQADLQHNPCCLNMQAALAQCSKSLEKFEDTKLNGQRIRSRVRWRESGNACNKEFF
jgi:exonuclease III